MSLLSFISPQTIFLAKSKANKEIKVVEFMGKKAIYVDGAPQSGAEILPMWKRVIRKVFNFPASPAGRQFSIFNCLVLGVGGGDVIKVLKDSYSEVHITAVDIDPVMIGIAKKYFNLEKVSFLKTFISDAVSFVFSEKRKFDLIIVDLFVGEYNPKKSRELRFLNIIKKILNKDGLILYNSHYRESDPIEFKTFKEKCMKVFTVVDDIFSYKRNHVLLMHN